MSNRTQYMPRKMTPETAIKRVVRQYLGYKGWFIFPILQGLGAMKGIPDLIAVRNGEVLFLEIKTPKGQQSEDQKWFQEQIAEHCGKYYVIRSVEDIEAILLERITTGTQAI